ncbi:MAG: efflux RND transporter periplasmic adaptor subunit, partial [Chitinophagales bacterium]|nr:efflux RND transporter periplasmic adaptor subunit [Chitinophagales bacterium]
MKFIIKSNTIHCLFFVLFFSLISCNTHHAEDGHTHANSASSQGENNNVNANSIETEPTITALTDEQINSVGIIFGKVEQKQLTATLKANGALRVPNNNKANATSLYGGVIKSIHVQVGSFVKSGQVIATIVNPQFIQLQEEYLTVSSKIQYAEQELSRQKLLNDGNAGALK